MTSTQFEIPNPMSQRLVRMIDGRLGLRGAMRVEVREPAPDSQLSPLNAQPVLDFIASDETPDRFGEVILAAGWRIENYRRNPVFQNAHQYGDVVHTLGRALVTEVRPAGRGSGSAHLFQRIEFAVDVNPLARIAYGLYKGKFLSAVSVGFIPLRWEAPPDPDRAGYRRRYLEQELLEVSAVAIPANPNALRLGLKTGAIEKADVNAVLELVRRWKTQEFRSEPAATDPHAGASGVRGDEAQLLQLARALREILRRT